MEPDGYASDGYASDVVAGVVDELLGSACVAFVAFGTLGGGASSSYEPSLAGGASSKLCVDAFGVGVNALSGAGSVAGVSGGGDGGCGAPAGGDEGNASGVPSKYDPSSASADG